MGLYNALFGVSPAAQRLLSTMGLEAEFFNNIPRFRDIYFKLPDNVIIFTRTGGGNREAYEEENESLRRIKGFVSDHDDGYDCTYAHFIYKISSEEAEKFLNEIPSEHMEKVLQRVTQVPTDKFKIALDDLKKKKDSDGDRNS